MTTDPNQLPLDQPGDCDDPTSTAAPDVQVSESITPVEPTPPETRKPFWGNMVGAVTGAAGAVGSTVVNAGGAVAGTIAGAAGAVGNTAVQAGEAIAETAIGVAGTVGNKAIQATHGAGYVLELIANNPQLKTLTQALKVDWLLAIVSTVDLVKAEAQVKKLQQKYPQETPRQIARRIMVEKAFYVGASGFANSFMPGFAAAMFAVDLATTMALQAEMTYQIAGAYGLDLQEPARKGEILAIFGIALGGKAAVKAGLGFARNLPVAGAVIGAGSNAAMLYSLGHAACQFYEAKLKSGADDVNLAASQTENDQYLEGILGQSAIMDQLLLRLILAGNPDKPFKQLLPKIQKLNLSSAAIEAMVANPDNLPSVDELLDQLSPEFAIPLVAQCEKIAQADGLVTPQEAEVIHAITQKFSTVLASRQEP